MKVRAIDLFCGGGGSSWGAKAAGAEIVCGIDAWDVATRTYAANFPEAKAITMRMASRTSPSLLGDLGKIDLILASPECTNHTCARGSRPRVEESRLTAHYVVRFARDLAPRWIVIENVIQMRNWIGYEKLVRGLSDLGYFIREEVLNSTGFGVPQTRKRLFLVCDNRTMPEAVGANARDAGPAARDVISWDGGFTSRPLYREGRAEGTIARAERAIASLGRGTPFLIVYYGTDGGGGWQPLTRPIRTLTTLDRFGLVTWKGRTPMLRMLQVPELQRAMGFSADYRLDHGTRRDRIKLLGNAVCPPVMRTLVQSLTAGTGYMMAAE